MTEPAPSGVNRRLALIGDIGGHSRQLDRALRALGADPDTGTLPDELTICQVGDLIHRGPDTPGTLDMVERFRINGQGRWIQLAGNHEANHLRPAGFQWNEKLPARSIELLRSWWESGFLQLAAAFETTGLEVRRTGGTHETIGQGPLLVTHAGLTAGLWTELGAPDDVHEIAARINAAARGTGPTPEANVWRPGSMLTGTRDAAAGVLWAESGGELYDSWYALQQYVAEAGENMPFIHQVHGHSLAFWWDAGRWNQTLSSRIGADPSVPVRARADRSTRQTRVEVGSITFWGIDPGHGRHAIPAWEPLTLELEA